MPYQATVIPVMIASPGDVQEYRSIARDVIHEWNYMNSVTAGVVLMPVGWDTHSSPELGASAQELLNDRVLVDCDLLVGIFWTRLGTPTANAASGTVEEIRRHVDAGRPAMVYFSTAPASLDTVDPQQYAALKDFRKWCESRGLIGTLDNALDFQNKLRRQLQITLQKSDYLRTLLRGPVLSADRAIASPDSAPADPRATLANSLTEEARILLVEASEDKNGIISKLATLGGRFIQTNGKTLGDPSDRRSSARWEYALDQLVATELVVERGTKGQVFEMTAPGYDLVDYLKTLTRQESVSRAANVVADESDQVGPIG
jgi:hypothetical protein